MVRYGCRDYQCTVEMAFDPLELAPGEPELEEPPAPELRKVP